MYLRIHYNIILPSVSRSSKLCLSLRYHDQNPRTLFCSFPTSPISPAHLILLDLVTQINILWGVQIMKLLITQFFPISCFLVPLYFLTYSVFVLTSVRQTKFNTHTKHETKLYFYTILCLCFFFDIKKGEKQLLYRILAGISSVHSVLNFVPTFTFKPLK
jgi:hypothetical protein